jgi:hypothetical protein
LNCCCGTGLHEIGKSTSPSRSAVAGAARFSNTVSVDPKRTPAIRKFAMTDPGLDFLSKTVSKAFIDVSNSFIVSILMKKLNAFR